MIKFRANDMCLKFAYTRFVTTSQLKNDQIFCVPVLYGRHTHTQSTPPALETKMSLKVKKLFPEKCPELILLVK